MANKKAIINSIGSQRTQRAIRNLDALEYGETVPVAGTAGYEKGHVFTLTNAAAGQSLKWINQGTFASCTFVPFGPVFGYGINAAGAADALVTSGVETIASPGFANTDIAIAGHIASDDTDYIASVAITDDQNEMVITASAAPNAHGYMWAALRNKCDPDWDVFAAGTQVCTASASTATTATGTLATDIGLACYQVTDDTDAIVKTVCSADTVTVTHSTTSSTGHTYGYAVLRPRGTFKPSHYIYDAGSAVTTTADATGIATNDVTVAGSLTTDIAFAVIHTQGGTIEIARAQVATAGTLTVQFSADPDVTSKFSWMLLRAY